MISSVLPEIPTSPKETRTINFQLLLTPTEHKNLSEISKVYGLSRGGFCRLGMNGLMEQIQRESASTGSQGVPVTTDSFWQTFGKQ